MRGGEGRVFFSFFFFEKNTSLIHFHISLVSSILILCSFCFSLVCVLFVRKYFSYTYFDFLSNLVFFFFAGEAANEEAQTPPDLPMARRSDPMGQQVDVGRAPLHAKNAFSVTACVWFPRAMSVHSGLRIQQRGRWPSLCERLCACTREVLGCCRVTVFSRV